MSEKIGGGNPFEGEGSFFKGEEKTNSDDQRVKDIEQAWIGAHAEKPIRDLALEEGVSKEEKAILVRLAERRGEKAMQEYLAEKEKNPIERLLLCIDKIIAEMREKGLEQDASIVEKIKDRFTRYSEALRENKKKFEQKFNRRVSLQELQRTNSYMVRDGIPVTHQIGEGGGWVYWSDGGVSDWFRGEDLEIYKDSFERDKTRGAEVINFSFSDQGETEFYRGLGVLGKDEEVIDIPVIYQRAANKSIDPRNFNACFPTNIKGVSVKIEKKAQSFYDGRKEERILLKFEDEFLETILSKK